MDVIRTVKRSNFTTIDNSIIRDKNISLRAKGLLLTIVSFADTWNFTVAGLIEVLHEKRGVVYRVIRELIAHGYCVRMENRDKGMFKGYTYTFYESLQDNPRTVFHQRYTASGTLIKEQEIKEEALRDEAGVGVEAYVHVRGQYVGQSDDFFADLESELGTPSPTTQPLIDIKPKHRAFKKTQIPESAYADMYSLCYAAGTTSEVKFLNTQQRGRIEKALAQLRDADVDFTRLADFETWWKASWMSKARDTQQYMPPRPEQVTEYWLVATKQAQPKHTTNGKPVETNAPSLAEIEQAFRAKQGEHKR